MDYLQKARRVLEIEIGELQRLADRLDEQFERAIQLILEVIESGRKIIIIGVGKSGQIGEKIAATLTSTGSPAFVLNPVNALHGDLGIVATGDAVIAIVHSFVPRRLPVRYLANRDDTTHQSTNSQQNKWSAHVIARK